MTATARADHRYHPRVAKAGDLIKELQRRLRHLGRLSGTLVHSADGPVLLHIESVRDPFAAADLGRDRPPTLAALAAAFQLRDAPQRVTSAFVARARRDLRALESDTWQALVRDAPRLFRGDAALEPAWWSARDARVQALTAALHPRDPVAASSPASLVEALHGPDAAGVLADWIDRSAAIGARRRREARRRIDALVRRLGERGPAGETTGLSVTLDAAARVAVRLARPGRSSDRRLDALLRSVLAWPAAPAGHATPPDPPDHAPVPSASLSPRDLAALQARVRARSEPLIRALAATRTPVHLAALRRTLTAYVLAFAPDPADPPPALDPDALELAADRLREAAAAGPPAGLTLPRALWLLRLPVDTSTRAAVTPWIAAGFPTALLEQVVAHDQHARLAGLHGDVDLAIAYADWLVRLVPHYKQLGVSLELEPAHFARLHAAHRGGLALLAHCLVEHHAPGERGAEAQVARLRATLGLFAARPRRAEALLADLSLAPAGVGRTTFPEFAAWLGDDDLLDRYCHLCALASEPVALSHTLRRDLERIPRIVRQRDWLAARPDRSPDQAARLAHLSAEIAASELADPAWTRRRLAERCDVLQARAFARRLDDILRELLLESIGAAPQTLTPAWRDAFRFFLGAAERNRGLLIRLLRHAAAEPGRPVAPTLPLGQAWIARAARHMRADAWLAPRRRTLELAAHRLTIALEDDPLEVLRMGIPFDTCLSLTDGFNAESTVLNAVDPNKRVLYVRDARGAVVARKLLAVSSEFHLLGYRLYMVRGDLPGLGDAVRAFCRELAADCALELADAGAPATIHPGFWYDDGTAAWAGLAHVARTSLAGYFARMGHAPPAELSDWATRVLHAWDAWACDDAPRARAVLPRLRHASCREALADTITAQLGPQGLARAARLDDDLAVVLLQRTARSGFPALLQTAGGLGRLGHRLSEVGDAIDHAPSSPAIARAWLAATARTRRVARYDDHGLEHQTNNLDRHLALLPIAEFLPACAELCDLWDWILAESPGCTDCRGATEDRVRRAAAAAYARAPDPAAVLAGLQGRHGRFAQTVALELAARFSLAIQPCPLGHGLGATWVTRLLQRPLPAPPAVSALRALQRRRPDLEGSPDMFAALVRQLGPRGDHTDLPTPTSSPLPALAELLIHLPDHDLLARWLEPSHRTPGSWQPDRWTLHAHRRRLTPWRRHLRRLADHGDDPRDDPARRWLAQLGDEHAPHCALTRDVARQRDLPPVFWDTPSPVPLTAPTTQDPQAVDLVLLAGAVHTFHRVRDPDQLAVALAICERAGLEHSAWSDLLGLLAPPGAPPHAATHATIAAMLARSELRGLDCEPLVGMTAARALHPAVVARLVDNVTHHYAQVHTLYSRLALAHSPDPAARDALLADFIAAVGKPSAEVDTAMRSDDRARFLACLPIWNTRPLPDWLEIYRALLDPHFQLLALGARLPTLTPADRDALRALVADDWDPPTRDPDDAAARTWLLTALA